MEERMNKEDILYKAIGEFEDTTGKLIVNFSTNNDLLKLFVKSVIKFSFAYKDIVWVNKLRLMEKGISDHIKEVEGNEIELLCNWNPEFREEVKKKLAEANTQAPSKEGGV